MGVWVRVGGWVGGWRWMGVERARQRDEAGVEQGSAGAPLGAWPRAARERQRGVCRTGRRCTGQRRPAFHGAPHIAHGEQALVKEEHHAQQQEEHTRACQPQPNLCAQSRVEAYEREAAHRRQPRSVRGGQGGRW
eukprot:scaffold8989_cov93-Isochrysis_galbana.AAC.3